MSDEESIKKALEAGDNAGMEHYRKAGEMLLEAKAQLRDGKWPGWLKRNFGLSEETARRYMDLAAFALLGIGPSATRSEAPKKGGKP